VDRESTELDVPAEHRTHRRDRHCQIADERVMGECHYRLRFGRPREILQQGAFDHYQESFDAIPSDLTDPAIRESPALVSDCFGRVSTTS
jgi:hypothetical protein